jgi:hypothetical protein
MIIKRYFCCTPACALQICSLALSGSKRHGGGGVYRFAGLFARLILAEAWR